LRKFIVGVVVGALLTVVVPVAAEQINKKVTATVRSDFSVELDGKKVDLKNSPLAYDGSSYLPVKEISTLLGKDVDFENGVIKIITKDGEYPMYPLPDPDPENARSKLEGDIVSLKFRLVGYASDLKDATDPVKISEINTKVAIAEKELKESEEKLEEFFKKHPELRR